jgi:hypothetical protein
MELRKVGQSFVHLAIMEMFQAARRVTIPDDMRRAGHTTRVTHRNGLFRLGAILGRIARHAETRRVEIGGFRTLAGAWAGFRD